RCPGLMQCADRRPSTRPVPERAYLGPERALAGLDDMEEAHLGRQEGSEETWRRFLGVPVSYARARQIAERGT
ncbi:MAG: hypothetical protein ACYCTE_13035, partial [Acidimicrobiales bacterium]